jgi:hypothetical protein
MNGDDKPGSEHGESTPEQLHEHELDEERTARDAATESGSEEEARANLRRADKARYLREKLEQQARADRAREPGDDEG